MIEVNWVRCINSVKELTDFLKTKPRSLFASSNSMSLASSYLYLYQANLKSENTPYKATADAVRDLNAGDVDFMFVDFILDSIGEIFNQIAKIQYMSSGRLKMPIVLRGAIGIGGSAATHHSGSYFPMFVNIPGLRVVVPTTPYDAKGLLKTAIRSDDPVIFLEHKNLYNRKGPVPEEEYTIPFGQASISRAGTDATVVAVGSMVPKALEAADVLANEGKSIEVIDPRTLAPLDIGTILESVHKTGRLIVIDETFQPCGIGAEIAAQVMDRGFDDLDAPIRRLNGVHTPTPYSPALEAAIIPNTQSVVESIQALLAE